MKVLNQRQDAKQLCNPSLLKSLLVRLSGRCTPFDL